MKALPWETWRLLRVGRFFLVEKRSANRAKSLISMISMMSVISHCDIYICIYNIYIYTSICMCIYIHYMYYIFLFW